MFNLKIAWYAFKKRFYESFVRLGAELSYRSGVARTAKMTLGNKMLLACCYGGINNFMSNGKAPVSIMFRPALGSKNFVLMECKPSAKNLCINKNEFEPLKLKSKRLFDNLYLFTTKNKNKDHKYYIKAENGKRVITSGLLDSKVSKFPTKRKEGIVKKLGIIFSWPPSKEDNFWISFIAILDKNGELVTGVYNFANTWKFPDVKYVPYYYHNAKPTPRLKKGEKYKAIYLAIDRQGWIPYIDEKEFVA